MTERRRPTEQHMGDEWLVFGERVGLKTADIQSYQAVASPRFRVLRGVCVGDSHFRSLLALNGLTVASDYDFEDDLEFPANLEAVNKQVVGLFPKDCQVPFFCTLCLNLNGFL